MSDTAQKPNGKRKILEIAVLDFQSLSKDSSQDNMGHIVSEMIRTEAATDRRYFILIERERLQEVLRELELGQSGIVDESDARQIGKMAGADAVLIGSVIQMGNSISIDARLVDVESGRALASNRQFAEPDLQVLSRATHRLMTELAAAVYQIDIPKEKDLSQGSPHATREQETGSRPRIGGGDVVPRNRLRVSASSVLPSSKVSDYVPENVIDGKASTAWVEGVEGHGVGEWIRLDLAEPLKISKVAVINGYAKPGVYSKNGRVKTALVSLSESGPRYRIRLADHSELQTFEFEPVSTSRVSLTIESVYPGTKYEDTCISEIRLYAQ